MGKELSGLLCICGVSFLKVDVILKTSGGKKTPFVYQLDIICMKMLCSVANSFIINNK